MQTLIEELVAAIEPTWAASGHAVGALPAIATDALERARAHERCGLAELLDWIAARGVFPPQDLRSGFGEPPLVLYSDGRYAIQLLVWVDGRTTVHEHDFAGAFTVLSGASVQRRYTFEDATGDDAHLRLGRLALLDVGLLETGAVEPILAGPALIHSVFHLDRPTLTLVVRTDVRLSDRPQYDYWAPTVALDPDYADPRSVRQVQLLAALIRSSVTGWEVFACRVLSEAGLHATFRVLDLVVGLHDGRAPAGVLDAARERHGAPSVDAMLAAIREGRWEHAAARQRAGVHERDTRFVLGALLTGGSRAGVRRLLATRYPGRDADDVIQRFLVEALAPLAPASRSMFEDTVERLLRGEAEDVVARALSEHYPAAELASCIGAPATFVHDVSQSYLRALFR